MMPRRCGKRVPGDVNSDRPTTPPPIGGKPSMDKREFLRTAGGAGLSLFFAPHLLEKYAAMPVERLAEDEAFWLTIRGKYRLKPDYINLESGYYSMQAQPVLEAFIARVREINYEASYYLRTTQVPDKAKARDQLAAIAGCSPGE